MAEEETKYTKWQLREFLRLMPSAAAELANAYTTLNSAATINQAMESIEKGSVEYQGASIDVQARDTTYGNNGGSFSVWLPTFTKEQATKLIERVTEEMIEKIKSLDLESFKALCELIKSTEPGEESEAIQKKTLKTPRKRAVPKKYSYSGGLKGTKKKSRKSLPEVKMTGGTRRYEFK